MHGRDDDDDWDERVADLHYRDVHTYAVGHGVATEADLDPEGHCRTVRTVWIPRAAVEFVAPAPIAGVELGMEPLAQLADAAAARVALHPLVDGYRGWIEGQRAHLPALPDSQQTIGAELLHRAASAADRLAAGLQALTDPLMLRAFRLMNRAMARAARQRRPGEVPHWRPFQLAFILLNLRGLAEPDHYDRGIVDLSFFYQLPICFTTLVRIR